MNENQPPYAAGPNAEQPTLTPEEFNAVLYSMLGAGHEVLFWHGGLPRVTIHGADQSGNYGGSHAEPLHAFSIAYARFREGEQKP